MKKYFLLSTLVLLISCSLLNAQNYFQGTVTYKISYEGRELSAAEKAQMPSEQIVYYKDGQSRMEMITAMGNMTTISDSETKETVLLLDMMGNKMAVKSSKEENEAAVAEMAEPEINYLEETKEVAGYSCKKAEIKTEDASVTAYLTEDLNVKDANWQNYKGLKGVMLEYSATSKQDEDLIMTFTATEVKKSKVKTKIFSIPSDYQVMTQEEFKSMLGG